MKCRKGIEIAGGQLRPCGQCMPCRINKKRIWAGRIVQEWLYHPTRSYFLTLTYAPEYLPSPEIVDDKGRSCGTLRKRQFLQWVSDAQKNPNIGRFRYYAVGEYGDRHRRAHYHLAIFPEHPAQVVALSNHWKKGFVSSSEINHARCGYLANYVTKKLTGTRGPLPGAEPEFRSSSRNPPMGAAMCEAVIAQYKTPSGKKLLQERGDVNRTFRVDGRIYPLSEWALRKIRKSLGIPLLHRERIKHPNYLEYFPTGDAEWEPETALATEIKLNAEAQRKIHRTPHLKL